MLMMRGVLSSRGQTCTYREKRSILSHPQPCTLHGTYEERAQALVVDHFGHRCPPSRHLEIQGGNYAFDVITGIFTAVQRASPVHD